MKKITAFYLTGCPYCANARQALQDLIAENPEYGKVEIDWIEETQNPDLVAGHQYYYDPSMFDGFHKLYEAHRMTMGLIFIDQRLVSLPDVFFYSLVIKHFICTFSLLLFTLQRKYVMM